MRIRNRLYFSGAISIVLVIILGVVILLSSNQATRKAEIQNAAQAMSVTMSELNIVTYEYLLHREKRTEQQWNSIYSSTLEILEKTEEEAALTNSILADYVFLGRLFAQVTTNYKERRELIQEGASQKKIDATLLLEERQVAQLQIKAASIITDTSKLEREAVADLLAAQELTRKLTLILFIVLVFVVSTTSLLVTRSISKPMAEIIKSARIIGKGNLEHRIEFITKDEIGELATSFNEMTNDLKESTTSIANLNAANQQLAASEQQFKTEKNFTENLLETANSFIVVLDVNANITMFNKYAEKLTGYKKEEVLGKNWFDLFIPKQNGTIIPEVFANVLKEMPEVSSYVNPILCITGSDRLISWKNTIVKNEKGEISGILSIGNDITKRKQAEEEINKKSIELEKQYKKSEKQRIANLTVLSDLSETTKNLNIEISERILSEKIQKTLYDISSAVNTEDNLLDLFSKIRYFLGEIINTDNFLVALYNKKDDTVSLPFSVDEIDVFETYPAGKTLTKYVIKTGKPLLATNDVVEELIQKGVVETIGTPSEIWLGVPVEIENKVIGVISVQSYADPDLYVKKDLEILTFVSEEIALAIKNKRAADQIKQDLKIKTTLIQEIYHRTKNNMAVISAMLSMQSRRSKNEYVKSTFREINNKIQVMSLVHQKLYKAKDLSNINLKDYIVDLANLLMKSYGVLAERVTMKFDLQDVKILIDSAVPLGLIMNELVSNIFKHAFPNRQEGEIFIRLFNEEDNSINLELIDNGIGFPQNFDPRKDGSMGLTSVFSIAENQLKGEISVKSENGLKWHIKIKDNLHKKRV